MNKYEHKTLEIIIEDDSTYPIELKDIESNYHKYYFGVDGKSYPVSKHVIKIFEKDSLINSCAIIASGGSTEIFENSTLLDNDRLLVCCCNTVFNLSLPSLDLKWQVKADEATCFRIFKIEARYLVHGEIEITCIDKEGKINWQYSGADIFVSIKGEDPCIVKRDHILLRDFNSKKYKLNFNGEDINDR